MGLSRRPLDSPSCSRAKTFSASSKIASLQYPSRKLFFLDCQHQRIFCRTEQQYKCKSPQNCLLLDHTNVHISPLIVGTEIHNLLLAQTDFQRCIYALPRGSSTCTDHLGDVGDLALEKERSRSVGGSPATSTVPGTAERLYGRLFRFKLQVVAFGNRARALKNLKI